MGGPTQRLTRSQSGNLGADCCECVTEAGHDALGRVGQGAVQIEDDQLGPGVRHLAIVADGRSPMVTGDPNLRHLVTSITVLGVVKSRRAGRPLPLGLRYHGDRAAEPACSISPSIFVAIGLRTGWCDDCRASHRPSALSVLG